MRSTRAIFPLLFAAALAGCSFFTGEQKRIPPPIEYGLHSPYSDVHTLAIAPAINLSGSRDFDPLVVSDLLYAEMQQVEGLNVLPLNKTLIMMQRLHLHSLESPQDVQALADALNADGVVVPAITAYDPYNPPVVGMVLQLYTPAPHPGAVPAAKIETPKTVRSNPGGPVFVTDVPIDLSADAPPMKTLSAVPPDRQPVSQVSAVFNATNQSVIKELQVFAAGRTEYNTALMDRKFLLDSDAYLRFVTHAMVRRLMDVERSRSTDR